MNVLVLEDNKVQMIHLVNILKDEYKNANITKCSTNKELCRAVSKTEYDLYLLDIEVGNENGIDAISEMIKECPEEGRKIIYITAHRKHAIDAMNKTHCYDFIEKPYSKITLIKTISSCLQSSKNINSSISFLNYKVNGETQSINKNDILFIEYQNKKPVIHTKRSKYVLSRTTIKSLLGKLNDSSEHKFIRCRRSNIINLSYISAIKKSEAESIYYVELQSGHSVPIGEKYKMNVINEVMN